MGWRSRCRPRNCVSGEGYCKQHGALRGRDWFLASTISQRRILCCWVKFIIHSGTITHGTEFRGQCQEQIAFFFPVWTFHTRSQEIHMSMISVNKHSTLYVHPRTDITTNQAYLPSSHPSNPFSPQRATTVFFFPSYSIFQPIPHLLLRLW